MVELNYKNPAGREVLIPVYDYSEANELLASLASRYRDDVTPVSRGGRNRNKLFYYNEPAAFDIETTTIRPGTFDYENAEGRPVAFPYLFQFAFYGCVIFCRQYSEALDIFMWISEYFVNNRNRRVVMFDHNLGYEYQFFKDHWQINGRRSFALDEHHPVTLELENGIILRDSYKMTNMSLETLTADWSDAFFKEQEIMDYRRCRTPYDDLDNDTMLYSALDVLGLADSIVNYLDARAEKIWTKCPTSTSFIRAEVKRRVGVGVKRRTAEQKNYRRMLERIRINPDIYAMLLRQARGGNTHANRRITAKIIGDPEKGSGVGHWDITSSYPAQMVCYPEYPIGGWKELDEDPALADIELLEDNGYCTLFDVTMINPRIKPGVTVPYLANAKTRTLSGLPAYSDNGRYLRGAGMLATTIYGIEWSIIKSQYDYDDVVITRGYFAKKGFLPDIIRRYVLELYAKKTELKNVEGKEIEYTLAKTYVNGVFGMMFTKILRELWEVTPEGITLAAPKDPGEELEKFQKKTGYFAAYAWGSMVATLGRVYLQKMIDACGEYFLYCDTDSVFADHPEIVRPRIQALEADIKAKQRECGMRLIYNDIKGRPHELGGIDEEPECAFMTYGAKKYITKSGDNLTCTIAGVPKKHGSKIIGRMENFKLDMVFKGEETNKMGLWYIPDEGLTIHDDEGRPIRVYSNVAMLPVDYTLSLSADYKMCLTVEGLAGWYDFETAQPNQNEEYI